MIEIDFFRRGFVFLESRLDSNSKKIVPEYFKKKFFSNEYVIYYDPDTSPSLLSKFGFVICLIGLCMDTIEYTMEKNQILNKICSILSLYNKIDCEEFYNYLDELSGRFCLIISINDNIYVFNDACGCRSVYFHKTEKVIASHYNLIKLLYQLDDNPLFSSYIEYNKFQIANNKRAAWCLPGSASPVKGVDLLVCNHYLDLNTHTIRRFFPRGNMPISEVTDVAKFIIDKISNSLLCLQKNHYYIYQSITAGNDSRMSFVAAKNLLNKIHFFTYCKFNSFAKSDDELDNQEKDSINSYLFARNLANKFKLKFSAIDYQSNLTKEELSILSKNHYHFHLPGLISGFRKDAVNLDTHNTIHVRTNITELLRKSYFSIAKSSSLEIISKKFSLWSMYDEKSQFFSQIVDYYNGWIKQQQFDLLYNYKLGDLFYWEYRMNHWLSAVLINTDSIFDTFILFNNRKLLEFGLSVPENLKEVNELVYLLQKMQWPELLELKHPNQSFFTEDVFNYYKCSLYGIIDFFKQKYEFLTGNSFSIDNSYKISCYEHKYLYSLLFGFSNIYISKGDYITFQTYLNVDPNYIYYLDLTLITLYNSSFDMNASKLQIYMDDLIIYDSYTNVFARPNQIIYTFKPSANKCRIRIMLVACTDSDSFNGQVCIDHFIFRKESVSYKDFEPVIFSTSSLLKK